MRAVVASLLMLMMASWAGASPMPEPPETREESWPDSPRIKGMVCIEDGPPDLDRRAPRCWRHVPDAKVVLTPVDGGEALEATSGLWGDLLIPGLEPGTYHVEAQREGFADFGQEMEIEHHFSIPLRPLEVEFLAWVLDTAGSPIAGAELSAPDLGHGREPVAHHTTGADGSVLLQTRAGPNPLWASAPGHLEVQGERFFDGSPVEIRLPAVPEDFVHWNGTVEDQDGRPVQDAVVQVQAWHTLEHLRSFLEQDDHVQMPLRDQTDADGSFSLLVPSHPFEVHVRAPDHLESWAEVDPKEEPEPLVLQRFPGRSVELEVAVVDAQDGRPVEDVRLHVENLNWQQWECVRRLELTPEPEAEERPEPLAGGRVEGAPQRAVPVEDVEVMPQRHSHEPRDCHVNEQEEGVFLAELSPGRVVVRVHHDAWRSCHHACEPAYAPHVLTLDLEAEETRRVEIGLRALEKERTPVQGYVVEGAAGVPDAHLLFQGHPSGPYKSTRTDADGAYRLDLPPGLYEVEVRADGRLPWHGMVEIGTEVVDLDLPLVEDPHGGPHTGPPRGARPVPMAPPVPVEAIDPVIEDLERGDLRVTDPGPEEGAELAAAGPDGIDDESTEGEAVEAAGLGPYDPEARAAHLAGSEADLVPSDGSRHIVAAWAGPALLAGLALAWSRRRA